jgi:hypothetical protein
MAVSATAIARIWEGDGFRLFLSHKAEDKKEASNLKKQLRKYGVCAFVAHEDIKPTEAWQREIERALRSMDALAALMTKDFHNSFWTDQEVGFALGRRVPIIAVNLGRNPYGFIGSMQALKADWDDAAQEIVKLLVKNKEMFEAYVQAIADCASWNDGNDLATILPALKSLDEDQIQAVVDAYNSNSEAPGSWGFNGTRPSTYGRGLISHLDRWAPGEYEVSDGPAYRIRRVTKHKTTHASMKKRR